MHFTLAFIRSDHQIIVRQFAIDDSPEGTTTDLEAIKEFHLQGVIYPSTITKEQSRSILEEELKFHPIGTAEEFHLDENTFNSIEFHQAKKIFTTMLDKWLISNNLQLLESLFDTSERLTDLWPNNRTDFFEELWYILKRNLGTSSLKIIYNDINAREAKSQKTQLVQTRIDGERLPQPFEGGEFEKSLMGHYKNHFSKTFEITDYDKNLGKLVITSTIKESPVIIMAELYQFGSLQKALIKALLDGVNH